MNQSFKNNQFLRIVDDAKSTGAKPQVKAAASSTLPAADNAKREFGIVKPGENNFKQVIEESFGKL